MYMHMHMHYTCPCTCPCLCWFLWTHTQYHTHTWMTPQKLCWTLHSVLKPWHDYDLLSWHAAADKGRILTDAFSIWLPSRELQGNPSPPYVLSSLWRNSVSIPPAKLRGVVMMGSKCSLMLPWHSQREGGHKRVKTEERENYIFIAENNSRVIIISHWSISEWNGGRKWW